MVLGDLLPWQLGLSQGPLSCPGTVCPQGLVSHWEKAWISHSDTMAPAARSHHGTGTTLRGTPKAVTFEQEICDFRWRGSVSKGPGTKAWAWCGQQSVASGCRAASSLVLTDHPRCVCVLACLLGVGEEWERGGPSHSPPSTRAAQPVFSDYHVMASLTHSFINKISKS